MDQATRMQTIVDKTNGYTGLVETPIDPELSDNSAFAGLAKVKMHNWSSDHFEKVSAMHMKVKLPPMENVTMIFYPPTHLDAPIFLLFFLMIPRRVICHLNLCAPFRDEAYMAHWVAPLAEIKKQYAPFEVQKKFAPWMEALRHDATVFGTNPRDRLDDLHDCAMAYLDDYFAKLVKCEPVTDPERLAQIALFHDQFRDDIRTKDIAQSITAKFIGKEKSKRIFYEVST